MQRALDSCACCVNRPPCHSLVLRFGSDVRCAHFAADPRSASSANIWPSLTFSRSFGTGQALWWIYMNHLLLKDHYTLQL